MIEATVLCRVYVSPSRRLGVALQPAASTVRKPVFRCPAGAAFLN